MLLCDLIFISWYNFIFANSAGAAEYTDCVSAEESDSPTPTNVLDMTINNLMVSFEESGVALRGHRSQV